MAVIYAVLSAVTLGVAYDYSQYLWWLTLVALVPFFLAIDNVKTSLTNVFLIGLVFGSVFLGIVFVWFWSTLPLDWVGINNKLFSEFVIGVIWVFFSISPALFIGAFAVSFRLFKKNLVRVFFLAPIAWVLFEYARTFGFYLFSLGPGSNFGPHFTIGFLGYALANNSHLIRLSALGDVYTLSAFVVIINGIFYYIYTSSFSLSKKTLFMFLTVSVVALLSFFPVASVIYSKQKAGQELSVASLHTSFSSSLSISREEFDSRISTISNLFKQIQKSDRSPDIVILPEDSRFIINLIRLGTLKSFFNGIFGNHEVLIIGSSRVGSSDGKTRQKMFAYNTKTGSVQTVEKMFLLPYGEYMPYIYTDMFKLLGRNDIVSALNQNRSYSIGNGVRTIKFKNILIGGLFCSDVITPVFYKELTSKGANVFINIASESWFHKSKILNQQMMNIASVRAAANNRYFIQAGNGSPSFIINNKGVMVSESKWDGNSVVYGRVSTY